MFSWVYQDLKHPLPFTGSLLLGRGFIRELYVHMGFHPAWKYDEVHELLFRDGALTEAADRSYGMAALREKMRGDPLKPGSKASPAEIEEWIRKTFERDYDF